MTATPGGGAGARSVFSRIISGELPARWVYHEADSPVVAFHNRLKWERVMLLVVPREYMTQTALWTSPLITHTLRLAVSLGIEHCPEGFRVLSNFGKAAHQSQSHAHVHVISGNATNIADAPAEGDPIQVGSVIRETRRVANAPRAFRYFSAEGVKTQHDLLTGEALRDVANAAIREAKVMSPTGFRLKANYSMKAEGGGEPSLFLLCGGQLALYV